MRSICVELKTRCKHCGNPLILNAVVPDIYCKSCNKTNEILEKMWVELLEGPFEYEKGSEVTIIKGANQYSLSYRKMNPRCGKCRTFISEEKILEFSPSGIYKCEECGDIVSVRSAPGFLRSKYSELRYLVAEDEDMISNGDGNYKTPDATKPIIFTCPSCGGALKVDGTNRMMECEFCKNTIYLPDDLWFRLHPPKTVERWFLILT
jgi:Zn finger protein HypA/HybF involved in hydrogenase expression